MNKQDWALIILGMGLGSKLPAKCEGAADVIAVEYYNSSDKKKAEFLREAKDRSEKVSAMFQMVSEKLAAELASLEDSSA